MVNLSADIGNIGTITVIVECDDTLGQGPNNLIQKNA
jgi:hypothetical protein